MTFISPVVIWGMFLVSTSGTVYYGAIASGMYKGPLLALLRLYGQERRPCMLCRFLLSLGFSCLSGSSLLGGLVQPWAKNVPILVRVLGILMLGGAAVVYSRPALREMLPLWYYDLLRTASRQDRRFIANAWLRLPRKMRWRLNGDQAAFRVWADMVRVTVIYGAYDPESPWDRWN